jgi:hypothetical protein
MGLTKATRTATGYGDDPCAICSAGEPNSREANLNAYVFQESCAAVTQDSTRLYNRLPELAAQIRVEHEATAVALRRSVEHGIAAGDLLSEAKALVKHGQWLPWLAEHCSMSERTAQLYMRLAKQRDAITANTQPIADLTLNEAAALLMLSSDVRKLLTMHKTMDGMSGEELVQFCIANDVALYRDDTYDPNHGKTQEQMLEWHLFMVFLTHHGYHPEGACAHVEWVLQRSYITVGEWLNDDRWRRSQGMSSIPQFWKETCLAFIEQNRGRTIDEVIAELQQIALDRGPPKPAKLKRSRVQR